MVLDLYLNVNKHRHAGYEIDYLCIAHFLFGYALYMLRFPLLYAILIDAFFQCILRTKKGYKIMSDVFGNSIKVDYQLTYRYCDTIFIALGWWVASKTLSYKTNLIGNIKSNLFKDFVSNVITNN
jgi:hypothetical protein